MEEQSTSLWKRTFNFLRKKNSFEIISLFSSTVAVIVSFFSLYYSIWHWESTVNVVVNGPVVRTLDNEQQIGLNVALVNTGTENIYVARLAASCGFSPVSLSEDSQTVRVYDDETLEVIRRVPVEDWEANSSTIYRSRPGPPFNDILLKPGEVRNVKLYVGLDNQCVRQAMFAKQFRIEYEMIPAKGKILNDALLVGTLAFDDKTSVYTLPYNLVWRYEWDTLKSSVTTAYSPYNKQDVNITSFYHAKLDFHCYAWSIQYCSR